MYFNSEIVFLKYFKRTKFNLDISGLYQEISEQRMCINLLKFLKSEMN